MNSLNQNSRPVWVLWLFLLLPSFASLMIFLLRNTGLNPNTVAETAAVVLAGASLFSSIYCAIWIGKRFETNRAIITVVLAMVFLVVNLVISVFGCSPHLTFG